LTAVTSRLVSCTSIFACTAPVATMHVLGVSLMMPWGIRSQVSMLQLVNVAFQFLCCQVV